ncbi:hypothetical protein [Sphingomonas sp. 3-13AW]|uniref:hypothetical protein n=1 Tax=Sphingomonas sp. 3-13AW TaxID=3050450 RepID=UPI003BB73387
MADDVVPQNGGEHGLHPIEPVAASAGGAAQAAQIPEGHAPPEKAPPHADKQVEASMGKEAPARPNFSPQSGDPARSFRAHEPAGFAAGESQAFNLLDKAIKDTDWGWKAKAGEARELGRLTFINTQNAWIAAAVEDPKRATEAWVKATRRNPSSEMEQALAQRLKTNAETGKKQAVPGPGNLDTLAADIGQLANRRDLSESKSRKTALSASLGEWNVIRGDSQQRALQAKRSRSNELWSPEPNKGEDGLHLLKSFIKGFATHRESAQKKIESNKASLAGKAMEGIQKELGHVTTSIKKFETELNIPMSERESSGVVGRSREKVANTKAFRLGAGAANILGKVSKKANEAVSELAKGVAIQGAAMAANPGTVGGNQGTASYQARMAAFHQFQQSRTGMGPAR